jgi:hypothetical protein
MGSVLEHMESGDNPELLHINYNKRRVLMVKLKIVRVAAASAASLGLIAGFGGVAGASPHHNHQTTTVISTDTKTIQKNDVSVENDTQQSALTGDATVNGSSHHHDDSNNGGTAMTGDATNHNSTNVTGTIGNTAPDPVTVTPPSTPKGGKTIVDTDTKTVQVNDVSVSNSTSQSAQTGDATVNGGSGGSATTGDATNNNSTSVSLDVYNQ